MIAAADKQNRPAAFSWKQLNHKVQGLEQQLDYYSFLAAHDADPAVKKLVHTFDERGLELKSKNTNPKLPKRDLKGKAVSSMAKRATNKARG